MWRRLLAIMDGRQRFRLGLVLLVCQANVIAELFGLGVVFLLARKILSNAGDDHAAAVSILAFRFSDEREALGYLAVGAGLIYLLKFCLGVGTAHMRAGFVQHQQAIFTERLLKRYIEKGWLFFLRHNAAVLTQHAITDCSRLATGVLSEFIVVITELCMIVALFAALSFISWSATATMFVLLTLIMLVFQTAARPGLRRLASGSHQAKQERIEITDMILRGAKEVILYHRIDHFLMRLRRPMSDHVRIEAKAQTLRETPRYLFEFLAFLALMGVITVELWQGAQVATIAVVLAVFATASFRLVASISRLMASLTSMNTHYAMIGGLQPDLVVPASRTSLEVAAERPIAFQHKIVVRHVSLRHEGATRSSIDDVSFSLEQGARLGIVGSTGAGKSTLVELLLGVLPPQAGAIIIDGEPLCAATQRAWQEKISYVPQSPALFNDTVARNIAFGLPDEHIDMAELRRAARTANIQRFIEDELPKGYDTVISDRGTSLSAGQQQRLAIARALYRRPELVVLDEATSALDTVTESLVTEAIAGFGRNITVVIVAHRLSTVRNCDRILVLDQGRVIQDGTFEDLSKEPGQFRQQLGLANVVQGPASVGRL